MFRSQQKPMIVLQAFCALAFAPRTLKATVGVLQLLASVCVSSAGAFQTQALSIPVHMHCALTFAARQPNLLMPGGISRPLANPAYVQFWKASQWKRLFFFKIIWYHTPNTQPPDRTARRPRRGLFGWVSGIFLKIILKKHLLP